MEMIRNILEGYNIESFYNERGIKFTIRGVAYEIYSVKGTLFIIDMETKFNRELFGLREAKIIIQELCDGNRIKLSFKRAEWETKISEELYKCRNKKDVEFIYNCFTRLIDDLVEDRVEELEAEE